ncbi:TenA family protein [Thiotrichales bacterium 19S11-10]|nr:TenA family protein [Thiotrichales bacterium 19S11-10]
MKFDHLVEKHSADINQMFLLAFNQKLANGSLNKAQFCYYLAQDALYLVDFSKALAITGSKLEKAHHMSLFYQFAYHALSAEHALHQDYLNKANMKFTYHKNTACEAYTQFLLDHANYSEPVIAITALIPCFWVYQVIGEMIDKVAEKNNPYQAWINTYASTEFKESVISITNIFNEHAYGIDEEMTYLIYKTFKEAMNFEYRFWDNAYQESLKYRLSPV